MSVPQAPVEPSDYKLSPTFGARLVGMVLVILAVVMFASTAVVAAFGLPADLLVVVVLLVVVGVFGSGYVLTQRSYVVRLGEQGYRVRLIRGAGVTEARWQDVEDVVTASPGGIACVVLRLRDGSATTIPVAAVAGDREAFVRDLRSHLQRGQGLRRL